MFASTAEQRKTDPIWGPMPGGERMFETCLRIQAFIHSMEYLTREGINDVLLVAHGDVMAAMRIVMEGFVPGSPLIHKTDPSQKIGNCDMLEYTTTLGDTMPSWGRLVHLDQEFSEVPFNSLKDRVIHSVSALDDFLS